MKKNIFKKNISLLVIFLLMINVFAVQQVYAIGKGEERAQKLYTNEKYRRLTKLTNVSTDKFFTVRFSESINYKTINNDSIELIEKQSGEKVSLVFEPMEDVHNITAVRVIPQQSLIKGKDYYLFIHKTIETKDNKSNLVRGTITEISVNNVYSSFMVEGANFISADKVEVKFNEIVNHEKASTKEYYKINNIYPKKVTVIDGKTVQLTLEKPIVKYSKYSRSGEDVTIFVSSSITNSLGRHLSNNYNKQTKVFNNKNNETIYSGNSSYNTEVINGNVSILENKMTLSNVDVNGDIYVIGNKAKLNNINAKGTIYIDISSTGTIEFKGVKAPKVTIISGKKTDGINIESSKIGTLEDLNEPKLKINIDSDTKIDRNLANTSINNTPPTLNPSVTEAVYFNALPPEVYVKKGSSEKQSFEILIQATGATFKEDLNGTNYDRAFKVVSAPTGFDVGTYNNGELDRTAVKRTNPSTLKIRIDGRFPLYLDDRIILEFSENALNENERNIILKNKTVFVKLLVE